MGKFKDDVAYVEHHGATEVVSVAKYAARHMFEGENGKIYLIKAIAGVDEFDNTLDAMDAVKENPSAYVVNAKSSESVRRKTEEAIHKRGY
jgi:hypothetical protein